MIGELVNESVLQENEFQIRVESKKLKSGRFQVKFHANLKGEPVYGYLLVESGETLKKVTDQIKLELKSFESTQPFLNFDSLHFKSQNNLNNPLLVFKQ